MKYKVFVGIFVIIFVIFCTSVSDNVSENSEVHKLVKTDNKNAYYGSEQIQLNKSNNSLFSDSEYSYNHKLAVESLKFAVSAFSANVNNSNWGKNTNVNRDENVKKYFFENGFSNVKTYNYDVGLNDDSSKVAFAVGKKEYNSNTDIVAVAVRGGEYGLEWIDNFNIGTTENTFHVGFKKAAEGALPELNRYISENSSGKNIKLWICGYSRGGAVANIIASVFDANKEKNHCQIYAYTFASPKNVIVSKEKAHDTTYRNIFNILSPNDPLYNIPPDKWGFGRYGICVLFPDYNDLSYDNAVAVKSAVEKTYFSYSGKKLILSETGIDAVVNSVVKTSDSRNFFSDNFSAPICDFIRLNMEKYENENGVWIKYKPDDMVRKLHGEKGVESYEKIKNNRFFESLRQLGISIPEEFYTFVVFCHLRGYSEYEKVLFNEINVQELGDISMVTSSDTLFEAHGYDFYRSWLENVNISLLKFTKE